jgi:patatin-like phospholipase/acyl hydrolase
MVTLTDANLSSQSLIKKDFLGAHATTSASLTISILENYQNNQSAYLKASKAEQALFNETVKSIANQAVVSDEKTNVWVKEINKSAKAINAIWAVLATEPKIDADFSNDTEQNENLIVVFQN